MLKQHKQITKNFNSKEFDSPDVEFSGLDIERELVYKLQVMRDILNIAIIVNSGVRTAHWNEKVGGVSDSGHLTCTDVDISVNSSSHRYFIVLAAINVGFDRIGVYNNHVHLSVDKSKKPSLWIG